MSSEQLRRFPASARASAGKKAGMASSLSVLALTLTALNSASAARAPLAGEIQLKAVGDCKYETTVDGATYSWDLNPLKNPDGYYELQLSQGTTAKKYFYQFCGQLDLGTTDPGCQPCPLSCQKTRCGDDCAVLESSVDSASFFPTVICTTIGEWETQGSTEVSASYSLIDPADPKKGIKYTFGGGDECYPDARSMSVQVVCPEAAGLKPPFNPPTTITEQPQCVYNASYPHPAGCPTGGARKKGGSGGGLGFGGTFLIIFFVGGFTYFAGGYLYLTQKVGLAGMDAIPNLQFWRDLPGLTSDGVRYFAILCSDAFSKARAMASGAGGGSGASGGSYTTVN
ncbi:hypothetical protein RI054_02g08950 [Pseudoscourfieldia marina]